MEIRRRPRTFSMPPAEGDYKAIQGLEGERAGGGRKSSAMPIEEPLPLPPPLLLPSRVVEEYPYHQPAGEGLPRGEETNQIHGLLPPRGKRRENLLWSNGIHQNGHHPFPTISAESLDMTVL